MIRMMMYMKNSEGIKNIKKIKIMKKAKKFVCTVVSVMESAAISRYHGS
jgi:hypothetical protein